MKNLSHINKNKTHTVKCRKESVEKNLVTETNFKAQATKRKKELQNNAKIFFLKNYMKKSK